MSFPHESNKNHSEELIRAARYNECRMSISVHAPTRIESWISFLRAHSAITRQLNADLQNDHGLTLNDYEVLLHLSRADGQRMRRVDLAQSVILTASGITRLLDGLERQGLVEKDSCATDGRVSYAKLTDAGHAKLREAGSTHLRGVEDLFMSRFSDDELEQLASLLGRLPLRGKECSVEADPDACGPA
jgi:DNA-binding MarR family transcriptional regulator